MKQLEPHHDSVGRFYDQIDEAIRLEAEDPIEYAITLRYLQRYIPDNVTVADVGVGGGQYSELLARRGCRLHLADVSQRLLDAVVARGMPLPPLDTGEKLFYYRHVSQVLVHCEGKYQWFVRTRSG